MSGGASFTSFQPRSDQEPAPAEFVAHLYEMVNDSANFALISWNEGTEDFCVWNPRKLTTDVLPKYFTNSSYHQFLRQLAIYGFRKVDDYPGRCLWRYSHPSFVPGKIHLLNEIQGRRQQRRSESNSGEGSSEDGNQFVDAAVVQRFLRDNNIPGYGAAAEDVAELLRLGGGTVVEEPSSDNSTATSKYYVA